MDELSLILIVIIALLSIFPSNLSRKWKSISIYYPVVGVILFMAYERKVAMERNPQSVPIRIDMFVLAPVMAFIILMGLSRWFLVGMAMSNPTAERQPGRAGIQILLAILWAFACFLWFCAHF
jgi:hypothetical protein